MKKITLLLILIGLFSFSKIAAQCDPPTNFVLDSDFEHPIIITWNENNGTDNYEIEFGLTGFIPTGITNFSIITENILSDQLNQLPQNEWLDIYFRTDCGSETSEWVGPFTFYNFCVNDIHSFYQDFYDFLPDCWNEANIGNPNTSMSGLGNSNWELGDFSNQGITNAAKININNNINDWLIFPLLQGGFLVKNLNDNLFLDFEISLTQHNSTDLATLGLDDQIKLVLSPDFGETWYTINTWDSNSSISNTGQIESFVLSAFTDNYDLYRDSFLIALWVSSGENDDANVDFFIDNITAAAPATGSVNDFTSKEFNYFPSPTKDMLNFNANEIIDELAIYNILGQEVLSKNINSIASQLDMTNLKKGIYLMKIRIGNTIGTVNIIKE